MNYNYNQQEEKNNQQGEKYNHYCFGDKYLIGVSKQISKEEAEELLFNSPMLMYERNVYSKILQLKQKDRQIIINTLDKWEKEKSKKTSFVGLYWDIVLDFILYNNGIDTYKLAKELVDVRDSTSVKTVFDNIEKMRSNKGSVRGDGSEFARRICYYFKITEDIVRTGEGVMYDVKNGKDYTIKEVNAYCSSHDSVILKKMIADITGVKENEIKETQIQIAVKLKRMENKIYDFLNIILDEMIKNRE